MKKLILTVFLIIVLAGSFVFADDVQTSDTVIVYYFHGSFRCGTCVNMEKYSREAIQVNFQYELDSGRLEFKTVNVEESGNEHFVNDYQLYTKSLILSLVKDGKEVKSKNIDKIWELVRNKQKFIDYVTGEVNDFIKDVQ